MSDDGLVCCFKKKEGLRGGRNCQCGNALTEARYYLWHLGLMEIEGHKSLLLFSVSRC